MLVCVFFGCWYFGCTLDVCVHVVLGDVLYLGRVCVTWLFLGCVCGYALDVYIVCVVVSVCERERAREGGIPFIKICVLCMYGITTV